LRCSRFIVPSPFNTILKSDLSSEDRVYKVSLLTFKVRSTSMPSYLRLLIQDREHGRNLRSTTMTLCQPFTTTTFAKRAFQCSAPAVWNSLPQTVLSCDFVAVFKFRLTTFLFSHAFSSFSAHYNMLPGPSASEVTTLWLYTNLGPDFQNFLRFS